ncbi:MAG TPA: hypothetical protein VFT22_38590 [Kofleriaceae bacterium]|nr:hypothetical protein [Kofleriaceae bacterium]
MAVIAAALLRALVCLSLCAAVARAQPAAATSDALRDGNTAALAGDWQRVSELVAPLLDRPLSSADRAEAHRLAGIAAFFAQRTAAAEQHFLGYLRLELDGRLDPALYPPDVVAFFNDVASRHAAELRALHTPPRRRSWLYTLLPPWGQFQNGERTKGYVLGGVLGAALVTNLITYAYLRAWCDHTDGPAGGALTCTDGPGGRAGMRAAQRLRPINIASGIAFWALYAFGVYDGIRGYRRVSRELAVQPYIHVSTEGGGLGLSGSF